MTAASGIARPAPRFVADAEEFAARWGRDPAFRLLGFLLRCDAPDLLLTVKKIHSMSAPENTHEPREPLARAYAALVLLPFSWIAGRKLRWTPASRSAWLLETIDPEYFQRWFADLYAALPGEKRVTPRARADFAGVSTTSPILDGVRLDDLLRLALAAPVAAALIWRLSRRCGLDLAQAWRKSFSIYASHRAHFSRWPAATFITYADELNHPARWLAFRQSGGDTLAVVQNGERTSHPSFAFGRVDRYFVFGPRYADILRSLGVRGSLESVGALCLNEFHGMLTPLLARRAPPKWDVLYFDQGFSHNGLTDETNRSLTRIAENLGRMQADRGLRVAYQLRGYGPAESERRRVAVDTVRRLVPGADILENSTRGDSYRNALDAEVLVTFQSTIGFEMMRLGKKVLFVNYSGDPTETICGDERFQLEDPGSDYARFERKLGALLSARLESPPDEARERHEHFDGRVQARIARALTEVTR